MFSLQKFLGKEDKFFDLLEASAEQARNSVAALIALSNLPPGSRSLDDVILTRRQEKQIIGQINEALCTSFVTALEREDIASLANTLYKIPKTIEKVAERLIIAPVDFDARSLASQLVYLEKSIDTVCRMLKELRTKPQPDRIRAENEKLQVLEGEADKLMLQKIQELYSGKYAPVTAMFLNHIYELLEKAIDRCRDAGMVINHIILKNS